MKNSGKHIMKKIKSKTHSATEVTGELITTPPQEVGAVSEIAPQKTVEQRIQEAFPREVISGLVITQPMSDHETFETFQGIKLNINGQDLRLRWNTDVATQHQSTSGASFEDIIVSAVIGTLTAWGTCRMVILK